ncbi:hypothetical protein TNIN_364541 [Trichonephila inaurata madagascariensis]|uniref:Uncharacterized protein n=1 Tax=Trichonephila inaurata madagascariensis TaxID=2747483 RepID=A0A8X7CH71_9ARAC|nr:hypothetical protein TNIN_364541 [Trichonephila inaurata madagascariensis]
MLLKLKVCGQCWKQWLATNNIFTWMASSVSKTGTFGDGKPTYSCTFIHESPQSHRLIHYYLKRIHWALFRTPSDNCSKTPGHFPSICDHSKSFGGRYQQLEVHTRTDCMGYSWFIQDFSVQFSQRTFK